MHILQEVRLLNLKVPSKLDTRKGPTCSVTPNGLVLDV
jgi:hypothetical protein